MFHVCAVLPCNLVQFHSAISSNLQRNLISNYWKGSQYQASALCSLHIQQLASPRNDQKERGRERERGRMSTQVHVHTHNVTHLFMILSHTITLFSLRTTQKEVKGLIWFMDHSLLIPGSWVIEMLELGLTVVFVCSVCVCVCVCTCMNYLSHAFWLEFG
jgi:hypothetical protein